MAEKRKTQRIKKETILTLGDHKLKVLDISLEGCGLYCEDNRYRLNNLYFAHLTMGGVQLPLSVTFAYYNADIKRLGAEFIFPTGGDKQILERFIMLYKDNAK